MYDIRKLVQSREGQIMWYEKCIILAMRPLSLRKEGDLLEITLNYGIRGAHLIGQFCST